MTGKNEMLASK